MSPFSILFLLFFMIPLIEIYVLVQVGSVIGAGWTIFFVVFTAVIGAFLIRRQGFSTLQRFQGKVRSGEIPAREIVDGFCLLIAGAFLMTPGFFTDAMGFTLLVPPVRSLIYKRIGHLASVQVVRPTGTGQSEARANNTRTTIEGDYTKLDD